MFSMQMKDRTGRHGFVLRLALLVAFVGCLQVPAAQASPRPAPDAAVVRCEPASVVGQVGDILTVDLYVEGVSDLYGVDLQLAFDTAIADVVDEDAGLPGVQILPLSGFLQPGFVASKVADNAAGAIQYANTQLNPTLPANGSGSVARIRLLGQAAGAVNLTFTAHELADRDGLLIANTAQGCSITFSDPTPPDAAVVRCDPTSVAGQVGDILTVDLYVEGVSDLYGVDLQLAFDTAIADVVDEDAGLPGVQILPLSGFLQPGFVARKVADNAAGAIQYANTQLNPTLPATGSGSVARIRLLGQTAGAFNMTFTSP